MESNEFHGQEAFDQRLRKRASQEPFPIPEDYAGRVFATCAGLKDSDSKPVAAGRKKRAAYRWGGVAAAVLAVCIAAPNVSPRAAAAMADIPVLGAIVEIVTFRDYSYDDGHSSADVTVPELEGGAGAQEVNEQIQAYTDQLIAQFRQDCEDIGEGYQNLSVTSSVVTNSDTWFTLRIDATRTQASGYDFSRFYHIDKATGDEVTLKDLFAEGADYVGALSEEVLRQMKAQMAQDPDLAYFPEEFTAIDPEQNFYWNTDGDLVLVFDEYTLAAGSMGMPEFVIPASVYEGLRK